MWGASVLREEDPERARSTQRWRSSSTTESHSSSSGVQGLISLASCPEVPRNLSRALGGAMNKSWPVLGNRRGDNLTANGHTSCQQCRVAVTCIYRDELDQLDLTQPGEEDLNTYQRALAWESGGLRLDLGWPLPLALWGTVLWVHDKKHYL